ncbi:secreted protein [Edaphobacter aggregans]|jgi:predicted dehydrogenase|uniref:Secreted protein n=1 Tax=Edaphobacter aggregans TaxID=570835 RepID=A0A3R9R1U0_9BACT|nr:Gfo/Idh/MocA family oxidoreductase [Edaphobacter aggregans]RSL15851.1 secreted protein [Edaphobacter aggregans]
MISRREFLDGLAATAAGAAISSTAKSYAQIIGANDRVNFAILGLNGRGYAHLSALKNNDASARVTHVCDVDTTILKKFSGRAEKELGYAPTADQDYRKILASKDVDAITVALPDHWHAPMAILGLQSGKHVYVEKPSSHNPREGELLIEAQKKYGKLVQVGDQQRSSDYTIKIIQQVHDGLIGEPYYAKAWYVNKRKSMGYGKPAAVPATLNWDLWQGPAPRSEYVDNVHPYNWHWLTRYGTGETLNNGTHEVDVCRWALGVEYPTRVTASGGRYNFKDDWQFYDTLNTSFEYPGKMISWEGRCCQGMKIYDRERGSSILGTKGSLLIDRDGYELYDWNGKKTDEFKTGSQTSSTDTVGRDSMTDAHFLNFINGIRRGEKLNSPIPVANVSVTMLQLSNIAYFTNHELTIDTATGHVKNDPEAMKHWGRSYEKGWEVKV